MGLVGVRGGCGFVWFLEGCCLRAFWVVFILRGVAVRVGRKRCVGWFVVLLDLPGL